MKFLFLSVALTLVSIDYSLAQTNQNGLGYYNEGLRLQKTNHSSALNKFLIAARVSEGKDLDLQLRAINRTMALQAGERIPEIHQQLIQIRRNLLKTDRQDSLAATFYFSSGSFYDVDLSRGDSAVLFYRKSIAMRAQIFGENSGPVAECYHGMGDLFKYQLLDFDNAEACYEKSLAIRERMDVEPIQLARLYYNLATTNRSQNDYEKAISYGTRAIRAVKELNDLNFLERTYSIVANIYRDMGSYDSASHLYKLAIELNKKNEDKSASANLAGHLQGLGTSLALVGKNEEAIKSFEAAIKIYRNKSIPDKALYLNSLQQLGQLKLLEDEAAGLELLIEAKSLIRLYSMETSGQAAMVYINFGEYFASHKKSDSALFYYQKSLKATAVDFSSTDFTINPEFSSIEKRDKAYMALLGKAKIFSNLYLSTGDRKFAHAGLVSFSLAERLLVWSRAALDTEGAKWGYAEMNFVLYERSIALIFATFQREKEDSLLSLAFHYFESSKSRTLAESLQEAELAEPLILDDSLIEVLKTYRRSSIYLQTQIKKIQESHADPDNKLESLKRELGKVFRKIENTEQLINVKFPSYLKIKYDIKLPSFAQMKELVKERKTSILHYFYGSQSVYGLLISTEGVTFKKLTSTDSVDGKIQSYINFFHPSAVDFSRKAFVDYAYMANELYTILVKPFESLIGDGELIIIPDGPINLVPFEALIDSYDPEKEKSYLALSYLLNGRIISYAFSSAFLLNRSHQYLEDPKILAFGFTGSNSLRSGPRSPAAKVEIDASEIELKSLEGRFPMGKFFFGPAVTESNFKREAPKYDLIHLAVHGEGKTDQSYSASLFFVDSIGSADDGELHWYELFGIRLRASLAVLSACESGVGKEYRGEGMMSMSQAFAYSGCPNILLGLWKVDNRVSVQLMDNFYANLKEGHSVGTAIALSKRAYLANADELTANPRFWGALIPYGNDQLIKKKKGEWVYLITIALFIVVGTAIFFIKRK